MSRSTGTVKWFNESKGFGFIAPDDGSGDLFAHFSEIQSNGFKTLQEQQRVEFTVKRVAGNNRWVVIGVRAARADNTP